MTKSMATLSVRMDFIVGRCGGTDNEHQLSKAKLSVN